MPNGPASIDRDSFRQKMAALIDLNPLVNDEDDSWRTIMGGGARGKPGEGRSPDAW